MGRRLQASNAQKHILTGNHEKIAEMVKTAGGWNKSYASDNGRSILSLSLLSFNELPNDLDPGSMIYEAIKSSIADARNVDNKGNSLAHYAIYRNKAVQTLRLLNENGYPIDDKNNEGRTPLMQRCTMKSPFCDDGSIIEELKNLGADPMQEDGKGQDAFALAVKNLSVLSLHELVRNFPEQAKLSLTRIFPFYSDELLQNSKNAVGSYYPRKWGEQRERIDETNFLYFLLSERVPFADRDQLLEACKTAIKLFPNTTVESKERLFTDLCGQECAYLSDVIELEITPEKIQEGLNIAMDRYSSQEIAYWVSKGADIFKMNKDGRVPAYFLTQSGEMAEMALAVLKVMKDPFVKMNYDDITFAEAACSIPLKGNEGEEELSALSEIQTFVLRKRTASDRFAKRKPNIGV